MTQLGDTIDHFNNNNNKTLNLDLFFDLLQISRQILESTYDDDFIILIGETPAYLRPMIEPYRKLFNLPFTGKPYGCVNPRSGRPDSLGGFMPTEEQCQSYFNYLDTKTILTKEFVKSNWYKIILVDWSKGTSISGVSIFFNRYVGNINSSAICQDFGKAQPMLFISLANGNFTNIDPVLFEKHFIRNDTFNYNPTLIILLKTIKFYHSSYFLESEFPRFVPNYFPGMWITCPDPYEETNMMEYSEGLLELQKLTELFRLYIDYPLNDVSLLKLSEIVISIPNLTTDEISLVNSIKNNSHNLKMLRYNLNELFDRINEKMLIKKYHDN